MKGISAIIATILLLLIVVAIVGFTFSFFQSTFSTTTAANDRALNQTRTGMTQVVQVSQASGTFVVVSNMGASAVPTSQVGVFVNGAYAACTWTDTTGAAITQIAPSVYGKCTYSSVTCSAGQPVKVVTPYTSDTETC